MSGRERVPVHQRLALTVSEAADLLSVSRSYAYELVKSGELPHVKVGEGTIRIARRDLDAYLEEHRSGAGA